MNNLSIIFCVAIAAGLAKNKKTDAAIIAMICYFIFLYANNGALKLTGKLLEECGNGTGQAVVLGMQVVDCGVFGAYDDCLDGVLALEKAGNPRGTFIVHKCIPLEEEKKEWSFLARRVRSGGCMQ